MLGQRVLSARRLSLIVEGARQSPHNCKSLLGVKSSKEVLGNEISRSPWPRV